MSGRIKPRVKSFQEISYECVNRAVCKSENSVVAYFKSDDKGDDANVHIKELDVLRLEHRHVRFYKVKWEEVKKINGYKDDRGLRTITIYHWKRVIYCQVDHKVDEVEQFLLKNIINSKKLEQKKINFHEASQSELSTKASQSKHEKVSSTALTKEQESASNTSSNLSTTTSVTQTYTMEIFAGRIVNLPKQTQQCRDLTLPSISEPPRNINRRVKQPPKKIVPVRFIKSTVLVTKPSSTGTQTRPTIIIDPTRHGSRKHSSLSSYRLASSSHSRVITAPDPIQTRAHTITTTTISTMPTSSNTRPGISPKSFNQQMALYSFLPRFPPTVPPKK